VLSLLRLRSQPQRTPLASQRYNRLRDFRSSISFTLISQCSRRAGKGSRGEGRTGTKTCGGRAAKSTRSRVSRSDRGKEDKIHNIRRIHTRLPYTSLEITSCPDRQEPQHTGLHHQPQEQTLPDPIETLDGLSSTAAAAVRKNLRIHTTRRGTFQLHPASH
jgi:hypothetical protein